MLARDRPPPPAFTSRHSFHASSSSSSSSPFSSALGLSGVAMATKSNHTDKGHTPAKAKTPARRRSMSSSSSSTPRTSIMAESTLAKEKEFMANTRILALSNLIDSFASSSSQAKQGFYGKQLKIIGTAESPSGAELDLTIKIHILDNTWTTCPLLNSSTILRSWTATFLGSLSLTETGLAPAPEDYQLDDCLKDEKHQSWVGVAGERIETMSSVSSPTFDHKKRPFSTSSSSSLTGHASPETHVAILAGSLSFVANRAGDYLVRLSIHTPLVNHPGSCGVHLSQIPKCRSNFVKIKVAPPAGLNAERDHIQLGKNDHGLDFNSHPAISSVDEVPLNPNSDEDAQFWLDVQKELGKNNLVENLIDMSDPTTTSRDSAVKGSEDVTAPFQLAGCFAPSASLLISWMPRNTNQFVSEVVQDMSVRIAGMPDQTKTSTLLKGRTRKDPEDSHALEHTDHEDDDENLTQYEQLEMDDGDLNITVETILVVNVQKLGWKQPFMDISIGHAGMNDMTVLGIVGEAVQDWEAIEGNDTPVWPYPEDAALQEDVAENTGDEATSYRIWFFTGTEKTTTVFVQFSLCQSVLVGYGKDVMCKVPKVRVCGASQDKGQVRISCGSDFVIQQCSTRQIEASATENMLDKEATSVPKDPSTLVFRYNSADYDLSLLGHRYQALAKIARIERVQVEMGISAGQQPGFARVQLSNVVLPLQEDPYLRVHQLDGAEIWSVSVDGITCSKSIQVHDRRSQGGRAVLIPLSIEGSMEKDDGVHQVEFSYGFNTFDPLLNDGNSHDAPSTPIQLVVPGFNLPVGEYVVNCSLPRLSQNLEYDTPLSDFEVISSSGRWDQRRAIRYGAFMVMGQPKLCVPIISKTVTPSISAGHPSAEQAPTNQEHLASLEQISRTNAPVTPAHDPQQPPFNAAPTTQSPSSQRHPQQPPERQNPQAEPTLDGEILPVLSARQQTGDSLARSSSSNPLPRLGAPSSLHPAQGSALMSMGPPSLQGLTIEHLWQPRQWWWWKQLMVPVAVSIMVVMLINVVAFEPSTGVSIVSWTPKWRRPLVVMGQLWHGPTAELEQGGGDMGESWMDNLILSVPTPKVEKDQSFKVAHPHSGPPSTNGLELLTSVKKGDGGLGSDDEEEEREFKSRSGLIRWIQMLKEIVVGSLGLGRTGEGEAQDR